MFSPIYPTWLDGFAACSLCGACAWNDPKLEGAMLLSLGTER